MLDIEVEPNRPDFLSVFGVAREVSARDRRAVDRTRRARSTRLDEDAADVATITIEAPAACPEYLAKVIRGVDATGQSPLRAQARLTASGMRPVSVVVDATNYAMLELGQPLHAFDLDRLAGPGIVVRNAVDGERLVTLDGVDRVLDHDDLLICDLERPVAIGGVMGGATSEVSDATTDDPARERLLHADRACCARRAGWTCTAKRHIVSSEAPTQRVSSAVRRGVRG